MVKQRVLEKNAKYSEASERRSFGGEESIIKGDNILYPRDILSEYTETSFWDQYSDFDNWTKWTAR